MNINELPGVFILRLIPHFPFRWGFMLLLSTAVILLLRLLLYDVNSLNVCNQELTTMMFMYISEWQISSRFCAK